MILSSAWAFVGDWVSSAILLPKDCLLLSISMAGHAIHRCRAVSSSSPHSLQDGPSSSPIMDLHDLSRVVARPEPHEVHSTLPAHSSLLVVSDLVRKPLIYVACPLRISPPHLLLDDRPPRALVQWHLRLLEGGTLLRPLVRQLIPLKAAMRWDPEHNELSPSDFGVFQLPP